MKRLLKEILQKTPYISKLLREKEILQQRLEDAEKRLAEYDAYNLNLDLFQIETKSQDQREFEATNPAFSIKIMPGSNYPATVVEIVAQQRTFSENLLYGHLGLAKLIADYEFETILDIGSRNGTAAKAFAFLEKKVTTIEFSSDFECDYSGDYLEINFPQKFDAIWCSHVLEHQRNIGIFLEKIYRDLKENGVLALIVPSALSPLIIGHPNIFTPIHLIYHLVLAGFDCREVKIKCYDWQFTILVNKKFNGIKFFSFASTHFSDISPDGSGFVPELLNFFPIDIPQSGHIWGEVDVVNWS